MAAYNDQIRQGKSPSQAYEWLKTVSQKDSAVPVEQQEMADWLKRNPGKGPADFMRYQKTLVPSFNFNLQNQGIPAQQIAEGTTPEQMYKSFGPKAGVIRGIVEGRQSPPSSFAQKTPYWQDVMQKVYQVDPQWSEQRAQIRKNYTIPQGNNAAVQINAVNTAMGHVGILGESIDALNNGDLKALNRIANGLGVQAGQDAVTTFNTIVHRVGPELSKAYIGAGGSAGERGTDEKDFDPSLGPQQLKSNVAITARLLRSKIASLENQWEQNKAPGTKSFQNQFIMPEAKQQLDKWAPQQGAREISATGPNGHKIVVRGGRWVDAATGQPIQ